MISVKLLLAIMMSLALFSAKNAFAEKIIFASPEDIPPKVYKENGELKGIYIEVIREACKRMNAQAEFAAYPWARAMLLAKNGKVDAIYPPFQTEERKDFLYFTDKPMSLTKNVVFALKKHHLVVRNLNDLKGLVVGINYHYSYGSEFDAFKKNLTIDTSTDEEMLVRKLGTTNSVKRIDVAIASDDSFRYLSKRLGFAQDFEAIYVLSEDPSYVAFSKAKGTSAKALAERFNKNIQQLKKEGFVQRVTEKYLR